MLRGALSSFTKTINSLLKWKEISLRCFWKIFIRYFESVNSAHVFNPCYSKIHWNSFYPPFPQFYQLVVLVFSVIKRWHKDWLLWSLGKGKINTVICNLQYDVLICGQWKEKPGCYTEHVTPISHILSFDVGTVQRRTCDRAKYYRPCLYNTSDRTPYRKCYIYMWQLLWGWQPLCFEECKQHGFPHLRGRGTPSALKNSDGISRTFFSLLHSNRLCWRTSFLTSGLRVFFYKVLNGRSIKQSI